MATQNDFRAFAKQLVLDGDYRFIFFGPLLGVPKYNIALEPAGFLNTETMYPLDFEELLMVNRVQKDIIDQLEECFKERKPVFFLHAQLDFLQNPKD